MIGFNIKSNLSWSYFCMSEIYSFSAALMWVHFELPNGYIRNSLHLSNICLYMFCFFAGFVFKLLHFVALPPSLSLTLSPAPPYLRAHGAPIAVSAPPRPGRQTSQRGGTSQRPGSPLAAPAGASEW